MLGARLQTFSKYCRTDDRTVVGLTGGIASGKSAVSHILASHGIPIVDADVLARRVVEPGTSGHAQIVSTFGNDVLLKDGSRAIDRARLGEIIFNDERQRKLLNAIVHPAVRREMIWEVARYWLAGHKVCVLDVPLLIEAGLWKWCSKVVVVYWYAQLCLVIFQARQAKLLHI